MKPADNEQRQLIMHENTMNPKFQWNRRNGGPRNVCYVEAMRGLWEDEIKEKAKQTVCGSIIQSQELQAPGVPASKSKRQAHGSAKKRKRN